MPLESFWQFCLERFTVKAKQEGVPIDEERVSERVLLVGESEPNEVKRRARGRVLVGSGYSFRSGLLL